MERKPRGYYDSRNKDWEREEEEIEETLGEGTSQHERENGNREKDNV